MYEKQHYIKINVCEKSKNITKRESLWTKKKKFPQNQKRRKNHHHHRFSFKRLIIYAQDFCFHSQKKSGVDMLGWSSSSSSSWERKFYKHFLLHIFPLILFYLFFSHFNIESLLLLIKIFFTQPVHIQWQCLFYKILATEI